MRKLCALPLLLVACLPLQIAAQVGDELLARLDSPDKEVRNLALFNLQLLPRSELPLGLESKIAQLIDEAIDNPDDAVGESAGAYKLGLVRLALFYDDPRFLRGLAILGTNINGASQDFVAARARLALPYLDEAWAWNTAIGGRAGTIETWARMAAAVGTTVDRRGQIVVLNRLLMAAEAEPFAVVLAIDRRRLPLSGPIAEVVSETHEVELVRQDAQAAADRLSQLRDALSPAELRDQLMLWLDAVCLEATGAKEEWCAARTAQLVESGAGSNALSDFAEETERAFTSGLITDFERALVEDNGTHLGELLEPVALSLGIERASVTRDRGEGSVTKIV